MTQDLSRLPSFNPIYTRASQRKGGDTQLKALIKPALDCAELKAKDDAYFLSYMTRCVFNAGFVWKIVSAKWPNFERVFLNFKPELLLRLSDEQWETFASNSDIIRHYTKIKSVRENAFFVYDTALEHGSFGAFISQWPATQQVQLLNHLKKNGSRLGGMSGQYFLRFCGYDGFILSRDVVTALRGCGLEIAEQPRSQRDLKLIQSAFNQWHSETQLAHSALSQILGYSVGENPIP